MAKLETPFSFTGSLGNLSAYTMRGVDKIILRRKGGAAKDKIKTHPNFVNTRRVNAEFGGRSTCAKFIMYALRPVKPLGDFTLPGPLNSLLTRIQKLDMVNAWGERDIALSKNPKLLEGFSLNRHNPFDGVVRNALTCRVSRDSHSVELEIPALMPGINLFPPKSHAYFSIILTLGIVPDMLFTDDGYATGIGSDRLPFAKSDATPWYVTRNGSPATTLRVSIPEGIPVQAYTLLAAVGIRYGAPDGDEITQVLHAGSAKVLAVV